MTMEKSPIIPDFCQVARENEIEAHAEAIIEREISKRKGVVPAGLKEPVTFLADCSNAEQEVVQAALKQKVEQALADERAETTSETVNHSSGGSFYSTATVQELTRLMGRQPTTLTGKEDLSVSLMHIFLRRVCLRRCEGKFYIFDGGTYRQVSDLKMLVYTFLEPELSCGRANLLLRNIVDLLNAYPHIQASCTDFSPLKLPFLNGILELDTWTFRHVEPSDFFTNFVSVPFMEPPPPCPVFDQFLMALSGGDPDIITTTEEMIGYLLTRDMGGKCFFVLQGAGDTGKSVLANLISSLFNEEAVAHLDISRLGDRFSPAALQGKWLNVCADLPDGRLKKEAVGVIKQITGDDTISVEAKFKDVKSFKPTCKLLFASNFPLRLERDDAFLSRCILIPFVHPVPKDKQDRYLLIKLQAEKPGIVAKCLCAYRALRTRNYRFISLPGALGITGYSTYSELLDGFLKQQCTFIPGEFTTTSDLFCAFNSYCQFNGSYGLEDIVQFSRQLNNYCAGRIKPKRKRCPSGNLNGYEGIVITPLKGDFSYDN